MNENRLPRLPMPSLPTISVPSKERARALLKRDRDTPPEVSEAPTGPVIRRAEARDLAAVVALRALMFAHMGVAPEVLSGNEWQAQVRRWLQVNLNNPHVNVTVAVVNGSTVACTIGEVVDRMPSPRNPTGTVGMLGNVATFPEYRMTGLGQACIDAVMSWFVDQTKVTMIELNATPDGRRRYLRHGFVESTSPQMRLSITR